MALAANSVRGVPRARFMSPLGSWLPGAYRR